ncbi:MAG TPA: hypothetical protein VMB23_09580, partial [Spirochaetia bacterium]|nr:hypothetical protein [Spirochaetia bacterium]
HIDGFNDTGAVVASSDDTAASSTVHLVDLTSGPELSNTFTVPLAWNTTGTGSAAITLDWTSVNRVVDHIALTETDPTGSPRAVSGFPLSVPSGTTTAVYGESGIPAGSYTLKFVFYDAANTAVAFPTYTLLILGNQTTEVTVPVSAASFGSAPDAVRGAQTSWSGNQGVVTWNLPPSSTAEQLVVSRAQVGDPAGFTTLATVPGTTTTYTDPATIDSTKAWVYRIVGINRFTTSAGAAPTDVFLNPQTPALAAGDLDGQFGWSVVGTGSAVGNTFMVQVRASTISPYTGSLVIGDDTSGGGWGADVTHALGQTVNPSNGTQEFSFDMTYGYWGGQFALMSAGNLALGLHASQYDRAVSGNQFTLTLPSGHTLGAATGLDDSYFDWLRFHLVLTGDLLTVTVEDLTRGTAAQTLWSNTPMGTTTPGSGGTTDPTTWDSILLHFETEGTQFTNIGGPL